MDSVHCDRLFFSSHALQRMFERSISTADVAEAIQSGQVIMRYPEDRPLPSVLVLGYARSTPLHVVLAPAAAETCQIITVYHPNPAIWKDDFRTRR